MVRAFGEVYGHERKTAEFKCGMSEQNFLSAARSDNRAALRDMEQKSVLGPLLRSFEVLWLI
jgi:hypothetical protein